MIVMKKYMALFERLLIAVGQVMKILPKSFGEPQTVTNSVILTLLLDKKYLSTSYTDKTNFVINFSMVSRTVSNVRVLQAECYLLDSFFQSAPHR